MTPESDGSGQAHLDVSKPGAEEPPMSRGSRVPATAFASAVLSLIGGGLMVLGSFLPWANVSSFLNIFSRSGIDTGFGLVTVGLGLVLGTAGFAILLGRHVRARSLMIPAVVALVAIGWVAIPNELEMNVPHGPSWISWNGGLVPEVAHQGGSWPQGLVRTDPGEEFAVCLDLVAQRDDVADLLAVQVLA